MKLAVVTDSTAYLTEECQQHEDLYILPLSVIIDGKVYEEGRDIKEEEFYPLAQSSKEFPSTSQTSAGEVLELFEKLLASGYDTVICIHLSGGISGQGMSLSSMKNAVEGLDVHVFDSKITSLPMGKMVEAALVGIDTKQDLPAILKRMELIRDTTRAYIIVEDLNNLVRGGRLTNGAALIGGLLKIKPILTFEDGKIVLFEKIRSQKKALALTEETIEKRLAEAEQPMQLFVIHANNPELAQQEKERFEKKHPEVPIEVCSFGPVIGVHLGEKAIALGVVAK